jgi:hypothetical protein
MDKWGAQRRRGFEFSKRPDYVASLAQDYTYVMFIVGESH